MKKKENTTNTFKYTSKKKSVELKIYKSNEKLENFCLSCWKHETGKKKHKRGACEYKKSHFTWLTLCVLFLLTRACDVTGKNAFSLFCFRKRGLAIVIFCVKYVEQKTKTFFKEMYLEHVTIKRIVQFLFFWCYCWGLFLKFLKKRRELLWRQTDDKDINVTITLKLFSTVFVVILPSFVILSDFFYWNTTSFVLYFKKENIKITRFKVSFDILGII